VTGFATDGTASVGSARSKRTESLGLQYPLVRERENRSESVRQGTQERNKGREQKERREKSGAIMAKGPKRRGAGEKEREKGGNKCGV
jgi:hypothetical protein